MYQIVKSFSVESIELQNLLNASHLGLCVRLGVMGQKAVGAESFIFRTDGAYFFVRILTDTLKILTEEIMDGQNSNFAFNF